MSAILYSIRQLTDSQCSCAADLRRVRLGISNTTRSRLFCTRSNFVIFQLSLFCREWSCSNPSESQPRYKLWYLPCQQYDISLCASVTTDDSYKPGTQDKHIYRKLSRLDHMVCRSRSYSVKSRAFSVSQQSSKHRLFNSTSILQILYLLYILLAAKRLSASWSHAYCFDHWNCSKIFALQHNLIVAVLREIAINVYTGLICS